MISYCFWLCLIFGIASTYTRFSWMRWHRSFSCAGLHMSCICFCQLDRPMIFKGFEIHGRSRIHVVSQSVSLWGIRRTNVCVCFAWMCLDCIRKVSSAAVWRQRHAIATIKGQAKVILRIKKMNQSIEADDSCGFRRRILCLKSMNHLDERSS